MVVQSVTFRTVHTTRWAAIFSTEQVNPHRRKCLFYGCPPHSAVRCDAVRCGTGRGGAGRGGAVRCGAVCCPVLRCGSVKCPELQCCVLRRCASFRIHSITRYTCCVLVVLIFLRMISLGLHVFSPTKITPVLPIRTFHCHQGRSTAQHRTTSSGQAALRIIKWLFAPSHGPPLYLF